MIVRIDSVKSYDGRIKENKIREALIGTKRLNTNTLIDLALLLYEDDLTKLWKETYIQYTQFFPLAFKRALHVLLDFAILFFLSNIP